MDDPDCRPVGTYSADEIELRDGRVWRNGPARLIYDIVGIDKDCTNLDYSMVYQTKKDSVPYDELATKQAVESILEESCSGDESHLTIDENVNPPVNASLHQDYHAVSSEQSDDSFESSVPHGSKSSIADKVALVSLMEVMKQMKHDSHRSCDIFSEQKQSTCSMEEETVELVTMSNWEENVVWDAQTMKQKEIPKEKLDFIGWCPLENSKCPEVNIDENHSLFSFENKELVTGSWIDDITWDVTDVSNRMPPVPCVEEDLHVNYKIKEDKKLNFESKSHPITTKKQQPHSLKSKMLLKKTGFLNWSGKHRKEEEIEENAPATSTSSSSFDYDKSYNISNDEYYTYKAKDSQADFNVFLHSVLVRQLKPPFVYMHLTEDQLRHFHRPKLSYSTLPPPYTQDRKYTIISVAKRIHAKENESKKLLEKGMTVLFDKPIDLSGRDGEILFVENSEEHPLLLSKVGMCSKIVNFYKRKSHKKALPGPPSIPHKYGELKMIPDPSYQFLGSLQAGEVLSTLTNNMYSSPIYWHDPKETDFLLICSKTTGFMIRPFNGMFVAGQQCPKMEVPEPNSTKAKGIVKDIFLAFVFRKFREYSQSKDEKVSSPRISIDLILRHFPSLTESSIKTMLRDISEVIKVKNVTYFELKSGHVIPTELDLEEKVPPELACAYHSLLAGEQRLRDAGLHSVLTLTDENVTEEVDVKKPKKVKSNLVLDGQVSQQHPTPALNEEILSAPWNTTAAFLSAKQGKCLLQVVGPADPTGCGEGMSYVRVPKRSNIGVGPSGSTAESQAGTSGQTGTGGRGRPRANQPKTGSKDGDLRKLSAKNAKGLLRKHQVPEDAIQKLSRWELIDVVRTFSTEKVMSGEQVDKAMAKYCREKSFNSVAMNQERYKEACQQVFELQNKVLASQEILTSEDEDSEEEGNESVLDSEGCPGSQDIERLGKQIESILSGNADMDRLTHDEEERERLELQKMMLGGIKSKDAEAARKLEEEARVDKEKAESKNSTEEMIADLINNPGKVLSITRTYKEDGKLVDKTEVIKNTMVIAAYLRIRNTKTEAFIKTFLQKADKRDKKAKKERERIRQVRVSEEIVKTPEIPSKKRKLEAEDEYFPNNETKKKAIRRVSTSGRGRICGACKQHGHMKTSKLCPNFHETKKKMDEKKKLQSDGESLSPMDESSITSPRNATTDRTLSGSSSEDTESSSEESSDGDSDIDDYFLGNGNYQINESSLTPSHAGVFGRHDGVKLYLKKSLIQPYVQQAREEELLKDELEVAKALVYMSHGGPRLGKPILSKQNKKEPTTLKVMNMKYKKTEVDR